MEGSPWTLEERWRPCIITGWLIQSRRTSPVTALSDVAGDVTLHSGTLFKLCFILELEGQRLRPSLLHLTILVQGGLWGICSGNAMQAWTAENDSDSPEVSAERNRHVTRLVPVMRLVCWRVSQMHMYKTAISSGTVSIKRLNSCHKASLGHDAAQGEGGVP